MLSLRSSSSSTTRAKHQSSPVSTLQVPAARSGGARLGSSVVAAPCLVNRRKGMTTQLRQNTQAVAAFTEERSSGGPAPATESPVQEFVRGKAWAEAVVQLQHEVHALVSEQLGPLQPQPTKHAADGVLRVQGPGGKMVLDVTTHSGGAVWHKYLSTGGFPAFNMLYSKTSVSACPELMTPFLDVEIGGSETSILLAVFFAPRLCLLRHMDYMRKYYRTVPPGAPEGLPDFNTLYNRMLDRAQTSMGVVTATHNGADAAAPPPAAPLYRVFTSKQLWTRLQGHAALFSFDPRDAKAWEAVREDTRDLVRLWGAWAKADWEQAQAAGTTGPAAGSTDPCIVAEWRDRSRILVHSMDLDEETARAEMMMGAENMAKVKDTTSGVASLAPAPSWLLRG